MSAPTGHVSEAFVRGCIILKSYGVAELGPVVDVNLLEAVRLAARKLTYGLQRHGHASMSRVLQEDFGDRLNVTWLASGAFGTPVADLLNEPVSMTAGTETLRCSCDKIEYGAS